MVGDAGVEALVAAGAGGVLVTTGMVGDAGVVGVAWDGPAQAARAKARQRQNDPRETMRFFIIYFPSIML